jgi:hypothetical protein
VAGDRHLGGNHDRAPDEQDNSHRPEDAVLLGVQDPGHDEHLQHRDDLRDHEPDADDGGALD